LALLDFKFHFLAFSQAAETAGALDFAEVCEEVFATTVWGDEAKTFAVVKPFHDARLRGHIEFPFRVAAPAHAAAVQMRPRLNSPILKSAKPAKKLQKAKRKTNLSNNDLAQIYRVDCNRKVAGQSGLSFWPLLRG
jgi:hypothetical protein